MEQKTLTENVLDQKTEEVCRNILQELLLPMFNAWFDSLDERGGLAKLSCKVLAENYGIPEASGLALIFAGFVGGAMAAIFDPSEDKASMQDNDKE